MFTQLATLREGLPIRCGGTRCPRDGVYRGHASRSCAKTLTSINLDPPYVQVYRRKKTPFGNERGAAVLYVRQNFGFVWGPVRNLEKVFPSAYPSSSF